MARALVAGRPLASEQYFGLCDLPMLSPEAHKVYEQVFPERLKQFPQPSVDQNDHLCLLTKPELKIDHLYGLPWSHGLRHDAESSFWLLTWWAVHSRDPATKDPDASKIGTDLWKQLTSVDPREKKDERPFFLQKLTSPEGLNWLDPAYKNLQPLFRQMAIQIHQDNYWAKRATGCPQYMADPEFHHEALQRLILNFLMEHGNDGFMALQKHVKHRKIDSSPHQSSDISSTGTIRLRFSVAGSASSGGK